MLHELRRTSLMDFLFYYYYYSKSFAVNSPERHSTVNTKLNNKYFYHIFFLHFQITNKDRNSFLFSVIQQKKKSIIKKNSS